jgi:hypothetical protein
MKLKLEHIYSNISESDIRLLEEGKITKAVMDFIKGIGTSLYKLFASTGMQDTLRDVHFNKSDLETYKKNKKTFASWTPP